MAVNVWTRSPTGIDGDPMIKEMKGRIETLEASLVRVSQDAFNGYQGAAAAVGGLQSQVATVTQTANDTAAVVARLDALSTLVSASSVVPSTGITGFSAVSRPTAILSTPTGRLEIQFGGSMNGGDGYFVFSVVNTATPATVYVNRATMQTDPTQRIAVSGGASFAPSGYRTAVVNGLPINTNVTVTLEYYAVTTFTYFFGGNLLVRPAP